MKILVVDDEQHIVDFIEMGLELEGYQVLKAFDGEEAIKLAIIHQPHLVILDVMLPKLNGFEVCERLKEKFDMPIIMLTARDEVDDRVKGLTIGANDYVIKPFNFKELIARVKVQLRPLMKKEELIQKIGSFEINEKAYEIKYQDELLTLSPTEYKLLQYLLINHDIVLSKSKLLDYVWGIDFYGDENVVEVYIRYLRNKLKDDHREVIKTIRGAGYKLVTKND